MAHSSVCFTFAMTALPITALYQPPRLTDLTSMDGVEPLVANHRIPNFLLWFVDDPQMGLR